MGSEIVFVFEAADEGGYFARALGHSIFTQGETLAELRNMVREAVLVHFEADERPAAIRLRRA